MKKILAFTLAEVLIVIGILGVVAALTIPTLNSEAGIKEKVTRLKKSYSVLTDAFDRMMADMGPLDEIYSSLDLADAGYASVAINSKIASYMKTSNVCGGTASGGNGTATTNCNAAAYALSSAGASATINTYPGFVLTDGSSVSFNLNASCSTNDKIPGNTNVCGMMYVDVDGKDKGKNTAGYDVFAYYVTTDRITPVGLQDDTNAKCLDGGNVATGYALSGCTGWVITNGNEDYTNGDPLHCAKGGGALSWDKGMTSCIK